MAARPTADAQRKVSAAQAANGHDVPRPVNAILSWLDNSIWTEEAYFALPDTNHLLELANGRLIIHDLPALAHQRVSRQVFRLLDAWNDRATAGEVLYAPYRVRLAPGKIREPDVLFYLNEHLGRLEEQRGGPPDLVVEVLSPGTRQIDLEDKLVEYAQTGVAEYWIVDPANRWVELHALEGDHYRRVGRYTPGQQFTSILLPGLTLPVAEVLGVSAESSSGTRPPPPKQS